MQVYHILDYVQFCSAISEKCQREVQSEKEEENEEESVQKQYM